MIFKLDELENLQGPQLQQKAVTIKQRFDQKRSFYHNLRNQSLSLLNWNEINQAITDFEPIFNAWNNKWTQIQRTNILETYKHFFIEGEDIYKNMDHNLKDLIYVNQESQELESLKSNIMNKIENDFLEIKTHFQAEIEKGISNVLGLKAELGLEKNFGQKIESELTSSQKSKKRFMIAFFGTLIVMPIFLFASFYFSFFKGLDQVAVYTLRIGTTISLGVLSYFLYNQYKLFQALHLRYSHLNGFLGGGATFLTQLIGAENNDVKKEVNKKLAELFMSLEDIISILNKNTHPAEISMTNINKMIENLTKFKESGK